MLNGCKNVNDLEQKECLLSMRHQPSLSIYEYTGTREMRSVTNKNMRMIVNIKGPLSGLRQFLTIESRLKIMENAFYFMLKALLRS